jgi:hypothetical protein
MHQHIKKLWVDALRSGNYQQGARHLRSGDGYCCLEVLCDLHDQSKNGPGWAEEAMARVPDSFFYDKVLEHLKRNDWTYLGYDARLPLEVCKWAGIIPCGLTDASVEIKLSQMSDGGASFDEIADFIEQNL